MAKSEILRNQVENNNTIYKNNNNIILIKLWLLFTVQVSH